MINKEIDKTFDLLVKDADFLANFDEKLENFSSPSVTKEEQNQMIRKAWLFILHVIDYYVTVSMIDMDADLSRLCQKDPIKAAKISKSLNRTAIAMKNNYQYLCKEGTIYTTGLRGFVFLYGLCLGFKLDNVNIEEPVPFPCTYIDYSDVELIATGDDTELLEKKFQVCKTLDLTVQSIKDFIDSCFRWADGIDDILRRTHTDKTIADIDTERLTRVYVYCSGVAFKKTLTLEKFYAAIRNIEKPQHCIENADCFYALLLALYNSMGILSQRDKWLKSVLQNFELESSNYYNAKKRIENRITHKLCEHYDKIKELLCE